MKKWMSLFSALTLVSIAVWGCAGTESTSTVDTGAEPGDGTHVHEDGTVHADGEHEAEETVEVALFCGTCGHGVAKDAEHLCDADHAKCEKCGLHEGSELCCKIDGAEAAGKKFCAACGQVAGTDACCKEGAEVCADCGLHKGSPLCCKLVADE